MVQWDRVLQQLEQILNADFKLDRIPAAEWNKGAEDDGAGSALRSRTIDYRRHFYLYRDSGHIYTAAVQEPLLTPSETRLVEMTLDAFRAQDKRASTIHSEEERKAHLIRGWVEQQLEQGITDAELPESLAAAYSLYAPKLPLLIYGDYTDQRRAAHQELKKLLETFFDGEIVLIPLKDKEWLVLGPESLLQDEGEGEEETAEEAIAAIGHALHEMLVTEWVGECRIAADYPILPAKQLLASVTKLRETMALGRIYHVADNIHMPWTLHLEKLVHSIGEEQKLQFLERALKRSDVLKDPEMTTTLEQFIALDCSVSETAKKLFIHRNTLLYRLDKFKQETGLDVRTFRHALLVHVAFLLYKVTKRN